MTLTYHEIIAEFSSYLYSVTRASFEEHLQVVESLRRTDPHRAPVITFDDGHASQFRYAFPLLEKYASRATFFVAVGGIGVESQFMSWEELRRLVSAGHEIQSHGWSHKPLTLCSRMELRKELIRSREVLEERLGVPVEALSAPGGRWNRGLLEACAEAGYRRLYTSDAWRRAETQNGIQVFGRMMVRRSLDAHQLRRLLTTPGRSQLVSQVADSLKRGVRGLMGERAYHHLWCRLADDVERQRIDKAYICE